MTRRSPRSKPKWTRRGRAGDPADPPAVVGAETLESHPDGVWVVRRISGAAARKQYRCPGCQQEIRPETSHLVCWPDDKIADRRHWHTMCWTRRDRRMQA